MLRGRHIEPRMEQAEVCQDFLDACAAEARAGGWFRRHLGGRSTLKADVLTALAELGGGTSEQIAQRTGRSGGAVDKALRVLLNEGKIESPGKHRRTRVYVVVEGDDGQD